MRAIYSRTMMALLLTGNAFSQNTNSPSASAQDCKMVSKAVSRQDANSLCPKERPLPTVLDQEKADWSVVRNFVQSNIDVIREAGSIKAVMFDASYKAPGESMPSRYSANIPVSKPTYAIVDVLRSSGEMKPTLACITHLSRELRGHAKDWCKQSAEIPNSLGTRSEYVFAGDLFIGKFASETRENFGPGKLGEIEVNVVRKDDKYILSIFHDGKFEFDVEATPCNLDIRGYLKPLSGEAAALCNGDGHRRRNIFVYSQNGIKDPMADIYREKGIENPRMDMDYKPRYYGYIQWSVWGFRKIQ